MIPHLLWLCSPEICKKAEYEERLKAKFHKMAPLKYVLFCPFDHSHWEVSTDNDSLYQSISWSGGGGALIPHFGRYVPWQSAEWGALERAWACKNEGFRNWLCRTRLAGTSGGLLTLGRCLNALSSGWQQ